LKADNVYSLQGYKHDKVRSDSNALAGVMKAWFETEVQIKCVRFGRAMKAWFETEVEIKCVRIRTLWQG